MSMYRFCLGVLAFGALLEAQAGAQGPSPAPAKAKSTLRVDIPVGWRRHRFAPAEERGPRLAAVVCYPRRVSSKKGQPSAREGVEPEAEIALRKGGYPVIVFLHGFGRSGAQMMDVGRHFARAGYVAVLTDTTRFDRRLQAKNGRAFFHALELSNEDEESFLFGLLDISRVGIGGHSMGGGNSICVLADNPGYKSGFCFAPWMTHTRRGVTEDYVDRYAAKVDVPLGIVHGVRDRVLPWQLNARRLFEASKSDQSLKALWVLDRHASHANIARKRDQRPETLRVFDCSLKLATEFFDSTLRGKTAALKRSLESDRKLAGVVQIHSNR